MYKTSISISPGVHLQQDRADWNSSYVTSYAGASKASGDVLITTGESTPGFNKLKQQGRLLPATRFHQLEAKLKVYQDWGYTSVNNQNGWSRKLSGSYGLDGLSQSLDGDTSAGHYDGPELVQRAAAKYSGDWDALTFIAEFHQLRGLLGGAVEKVKIFLLQKPKTTPWSEWLQYRYGWRPLLYDIADVQEACAKLQKKKTGDFTSLVAASGKTWTQIQDSTYSFSDVNYTIRREDFLSLEARGRVTFRGSVFPIQFNPVKTWWEITRFSFIFDWLVNIGQWIDTLPFVTGAIQSVGSSGYKLTHEVRYSTLVSPKPGYTLLRNVPLGNVAENVYVGRTPLNVPLTPLISPKFDFQKAVDLVAILLQILRK